MGSGAGIPTRPPESSGSVARLGRRPRRLARRPAPAPPRPPTAEGPHPPSCAGPPLTLLSIPLTSLAAAGPCGMLAAARAAPSIWRGGEGKGGGEDLAPLVCGRLDVRCVARRGKGGRREECWTGKRFTPLFFNARIACPPPFGTMDGTPLTTYLSGVDANLVSKPERLRGKGRGGGMQ